MTGRNKYKPLLGCLTILVIASTWFAALAEAQQLTTYAHYIVSGDSAQNLLRAMLSNGPRVGGGRAYASARMDPQIKSSTALIGGHCRMLSVKIEMRFRILLPQLDANRVVDASLRKRFERFYSFAKQHEETHRAIWLQCAAEAEGRVIGITRSGCDESQAVAHKIVEDALKQCENRHAAFDAGEQKRLSQHPFVLEARTKPQTSSVVQVAFQ
jgi:predicted secreted Zn-dependent protease